MYTKQEARQIKQQFWTSLGRYMKPVPSASGNKVNWLNYKTGVKDIYIRMHADERSAGIGMECTHTDMELQELFFEHLQWLKKMLEAHTGEPWVWEANCTNDEGKIISRVHASIHNVNLMKQSDWPTLIAFFKPGLMALDAFWWEVRDGFESL